MKKRVIIDIQSKSILGTGNSQCKGSWAQHAEAERMRGGVIGKVGAAGRILQGHVGHCEDFGFGGVGAEE